MNAAHQDRPITGKSVPLDTTGHFDHAALAE
jgi:hypothetical protein